MRILVAAERLGREGGMERYLETVLPALAARGNAVHVAARVVDAAPAGITAQAIRWSEEHGAPDPTAAAALRALVASFAPDAAIAVNVMDAGILEALRAAPRLMYQMHDHRPLCPNGDRVFPRSGRTCTAPLGRACVLHALTDGCAYGPRPQTLALIAQRQRLRDAIARADRVLVASPYVGERAVACGIARARIVEIPPPLPDDAYAAETASAPVRAVCFAGRMVPQKGLLTLIGAVSRISPQARPLVRAFGDGPERLGAERLAAKHGVALEAPGSVSARHVREGLDSSMLLVMPSLWAEPFGMAGIEAFARGRPALAFAAGGIDAWLRDGHNGRTVRRAHSSAGDEDALGHAITTMLDDVAALARLGAHARADAEHYRLGPIVERLIEALV